MYANTWRSLTRDTALINQGGRCLYCFTELSRSSATSEHRRPIIKGGLDNPENIDAACYWCNKLKGSMSVPQFKKLLKCPCNVDYQVQGAIRRLNLQADRACKRILASVGIAA